MTKMTDLVWGSGEREEWEKRVDDTILNRALDAIWKISLNYRDIDLAEGHRTNIKEMIAFYLKKHASCKFVGLGHEVEGGNDVIIDGPHSPWWKDTATADWKQTPTGLDTFDNIFPESAAYILLDEVPDHYCYTWGILEMGNANNLRRLYFANINGDPKGYMTCAAKSVLGDMRATKYTRGIQLLERGKIRLDGEFETAIDSEQMPLAIHIFPFEIATSASLETFVTAT